MVNNATGYWMNYCKIVKYFEKLPEFCYVTMLLRKRQALIDTHMHIYKHKCVALAVRDHR